MTIKYVAELGSMHKGNPHLAHEMIRQFAQAGADTIKFQFGWTKEAQAYWGLEYNPVRYIDEYAYTIFRSCEQFGVEMLASTWSDDGLNIVRNLELPHRKIAAKQAGDYEFCKKVYSDGVPTYTALDRHSPYIDFHKQFNNFIPVWCRSIYPCYPYDLVEKNGYPGMPKEFSARVGSPWHGYSDHFHGISACLLAISRGAQYIEKHCCLDKADLATKDTPFSATPSEFAEMVRLGNEIASLVEIGV